MAAIRDHWRVQVQERDQWIDLDVLDPIAMTGTALAPAVDGTDLNRLPAELHHEVAVRVVTGWWSAGAPWRSACSSMCCDPPSCSASRSLTGRLERTLAETGRFDVYDIQFDFNSDRIREESEPTLREIAEVLGRHPDRNLVIEGHTDNIGSQRPPQILAIRRSLARP